MSRARSLANLANSGVFSADATTSRVGINSSAPERTLDVVGDGRVSGTLSIGGTINYEDVTSIDSIGVVTARDGVHIVSAGASIYSPANNELALYTNSSERVRVDSTGNVGIGTDNPSSILHITDNVPSGTSNVFINNTGGDSVIYLLNNDQYSAGLGTLADNGSYIELSGKWNSTNTNANRTFGRIGAFKENNTSADGAGYLSLYSRPDGGGLTERLRITSAGLVGIGTTNPQGKLTVSNGSAGLEFNPNSEQAIVSYNRVTSAYTPVGLQGSVVSLGIGGVGTALKIDSSGNVNIGSFYSFPHGKFNVQVDSTGSIPTDGITQNADANLGLSIVNTNNSATYSALRLETRTSLASSWMIANEWSSAYKGSLVFRSRSSGSGSSERLRIDSSGRLLVGTSTGSGDPLLIVQGNIASSTFEGQLSLRRGSQPPAGGGHGIGDVKFGDNSGGIGAEIRGISDGDWGTDDYPGRLVFSTTADGASSPTPKYTINSSGYFAYENKSIGLLNVPYTSYNASSNAVIGVFGAGNNTAVNNGAVYNMEFKMHGNASGQFLYANYITYGGSRTLGAYCTGTAWTNSSDIANKENISDTNYGLDTVLAMRSVDFRWKSQRDEDGKGKPDIGFIAQEMEELVPEVVTGQEGSKGISYGNLVAVLTKAIQEQQSMITDLQAKVAVLEAS